MKKIFNLARVLFILAIALASQSRAATMETATFAAGCFWGGEEFFRKVPGVMHTQVGYSGGDKKASYEEVSTGKTGHAESVEIQFDPKKVTYQDLLILFFKMHDPTTANRQGNDEGPQYRSAIFTHSKQQEKTAHELMNQIEKSGVWKKPLATQVEKAKIFYPAESEHQHYLVKHVGGYDNHYLRSLDFGLSTSDYKKPSDTELKKKLTPIQFEVTQRDGTEPAFHNSYWDRHDEGIYVDIVSGEPLFSSLDKYDSGTGWPSFTSPLVRENVVEKKDRTLFMERTEVRSKNAGSHLGHVFDDGPAPTGLRYCMNSAALRFVPVRDLKKEGYDRFLPLFKKSGK